MSKFTSFSWLLYFSFILLFKNRGINICFFIILFSLIELLYLFLDQRKILFKSKILFQSKIRSKLIMKVICRMNKHTSLGRKTVRLQESFWRARIFADHGFCCFIFLTPVDDLHLFFFLMELPCFWGHEKCFSLILLCVRICLYLSNTNAGLSFISLDFY